MNTKFITIAMLAIAVVLMLNTSTTEAQSCPIFQKVTGSGFFTVKNPIPQPNVTIDFDIANMNFMFSVDADYVREDTAWVVDFGRWDFRSRSISIPQNCENRLASSYAQAGSLAQYFASAADAYAPNALNALQNLAYGPANGWNQTAVSCNTVRYARKMSFSELLGCNDLGGNSLIKFNSLSLTSMLQYDGTLYVTAVNPIWKNAATKDQITGYETVEFQYPFLFKFGSMINDVVAISATNNFNMRVLNMKLNSDNKLQVTLRTELKSDNGDFLYNGLLTQQAFPVTMVENVTAAVSSELANGERVACQLNADGLCFQEWVVTSTQTLTTYQGLFAELWSIAVCQAVGQCDKQNLNPPTVTGQYKVTMDVVETKVGQNDFKTKISTHKEIAMATSFSGPFKAGDRIYVRDQLSVQTVDANKFSIKVNNAWICFPSDTTYVPKWNPTLNQFGCSQPIAGKLPASNLIQLIKTKLVSPANTVEAAFDTLLHAAQSLDALPYKSTVAFSFLAQSLAFQDAVYYIHIETEVSQADGSKRKMVSILQQNPTATGGSASNALGQQSSMSALFIEAPAKTTTTGATTTTGTTGSSTGSGIPILPISLGAGLGGAAALLMCCVGMVLFAGLIIIVRRRKNQEEHQKQPSTSSDSLPV